MWRMRSPVMVTARGFRPQRRWKSQPLGYRSLSLETRTEVSTTRFRAARIRMISGSVSVLARRRGSRRAWYSTSSAIQLPTPAAKPDAPEAARIGHDQLAPVVEDEVQLGEAGRPRVVRLLARRFELHAGAAGRGVEAARHAEVKARPRPAVQLEPEMLAVALHVLHATAHERPTDSRGRHPVEDDGIVGAAGLDDAAAARHLQGDTPAALDLRQLGHGAEHTVAGAGGATAGRSSPGVPPEFPRSS